MNYNRGISLYNINGRFQLRRIVTLALIFLSLYPMKSALGKDILKSNKKFKILHIMSYHSPWEWTDNQFDGFKDALKSLDVEYKVFQMDTKHKSSKEWMEYISKEAMDLIDSWNPDLVYINDDNAQKYVTSHYINSHIPFVFSGVNANPNKYGFDNAKNITGVLEQEHFVETIQLLKKIVPDVKKIAVVTDSGITWIGVMDRMKQKLDQVPDVIFVSWNVVETFREFKDKMKDLEKKVDAVALLGVFEFKDDASNNVPYTQVLRWTQENIKLPDFSFWKDRVSRGTLCTVSVSGYEQGFAAGIMAKSILAEHKAPASIQMKPSIKGEPVVSLARAKKLGIKIKTSILLSSEVMQKFAWEE